MTLGGDDGNPAWRCRVAVSADHNLYIEPEPRQAFEHHGFTDASKLAPKHLGYLGLRHANHFCRLALFPFVGLDDFADLGGQLGLYLHFISIRNVEVGINIGRPDSVYESVSGF